MVATHLKHHQVEIKPWTADWCSDYPSSGTARHEKVKSEAWKLWKLTHHTFAVNEGTREIERTAVDNPKELKIGSILPDIFQRYSSEGPDVLLYVSSIHLCGHNPKVACYWPKDNCYENYILKNCHQNGQNANFTHISSKSQALICGIS